MPSRAQQKQLQHFAGESGDAHLHSLWIKEQQLASSDNRKRRDQVWERYIEQFLRDHLKKKIRFAAMDVPIPPDGTQAWSDLVHAAMRQVEAYGSRMPALVDVDQVRSGREYELVCKGLFERAGWTVELTPSTGDHGGDLITRKGALKIAVQCKFYSGSVGNWAVMEVHTARSFYRCKAAVVISNSRYTAAAKHAAQKVNVLLLHHGDIARLDDLVASAR